MEGINSTVDWFSKSTPDPNYNNFYAQLTCHIEEYNEMLEVLGLLGQEQIQLHKDLLEGNYFDFIRDTFYDAPKDSPKKVAFLDSIGDQIVTATGTSYMLGQDVVGALDEINRSNFSKFDEDGNPVRNALGKITKGPNYTPPDLTPFVSRD